MSIPFHPAAPLTALRQVPGPATRA